MILQHGSALVGVMGDVHPTLAESALTHATRSLAHRGEITRFDDATSRRWVAIAGTVGEALVLRRVEGFAAGVGSSTIRVEVHPSRDGTSARLVADALGRRSLFATSLGVGALAFSSEIGALVSLLRSLGVPLTIDLAAWRRYFSLSFMPSPRSPWREIRVVRAGTEITWKRGEGFGNERERFEVPVDDPDRPVPTEEDDDRDADALLSELDAACDALLREARSPALLLSGGLDSAAIATSLGRMRPGATALTLDFEVESEASLAAQIAAHCGLRHERLPISVHDATLSIDRAVRAMTWPVADPVVVPFTMASRALANAGVDHVWNGEGGDQLFAGWATKPMLAWARYARPDDDPAQAYVHTFHKLADIESEALGPQFRDVLRTDTPVADDVRPYLIGPRALRHASFLHRLCEANLWLKGAGNILPRIDLAMASSGLEAVSPLLDESLVRRSFLLAPVQKQRGITEKWVLRHGLRSRLPTEILDLPKRGMKVPLRPWFEGKMGKVAKDILLSRTARQRGLLSPEFVKKVIDDDIRAPDLRRRRRDEWLWMALVTEMWMRVHT